MKNQLMRLCAWVCLALFVGLNSGHAQIRQIAKILPPNQSPNMSYGEADIDLKGDRLLIGVPKSEKAFLYKNPGSGFQLEQTFSKPANLPVMPQIKDPERVYGHAKFGKEVCLGPGHVLVGYDGYAYEMSGKPFKKWHISPGMVDYKAQAGGSYSQDRIFENYCGQVVSADSLLFVVGDYSDGMGSINMMPESNDTAVFRFYRLDQVGDYVLTKEYVLPDSAEYSTFHRRRNRTFAGISPSGNKMVAHANFSQIRAGAAYGLFYEHYSYRYFFTNQSGQIELEESKLEFFRNNHSFNYAFANRVCANEFLANNDEYAIVRQVRDIMSGPSDTSFTIWKYNNVSGTWTYDQDLVISGGTKPHITDVAMTDNLLFVGNQAHVGGGVEVFQLSGGTWQHINSIFPQDNQVGDQFGKSLVVDGTTLAIGAPGVDVLGKVDVGAVYLYQFDCELPAPFGLARVGNFPHTTRTCYNSTTNRLEIWSGGMDIYGPSDAFSFVYQPFLGDVVINASIRDLQPNPYWNLAGVMIRESLDPDAKNVFLGLNGASSTTHNLTLQHRSSTGAFTSGQTGTPMAKPAWLRLIRRGNNFEAWTSITGFFWDYLGQVQVPMNAQVYVGMAVSTPYDVGWRRFEFGDISVTSLNPSLAPRLGSRESKGIKTIPAYREKVSKIEYVEQFVNVSPNVFDNFIRVEAQWEIPASQAEIKVMDAQGRTVYHQNIAEPGNEWQGKLALPELTSGIYLLQFQAGDFNQTLRVIKK